MGSREEVGVVYHALRDLQHAECPARRVRAEPRQQVTNCLKLLRTGADNQEKGDAPTLEVREHQGSELRPREDSLQHRHTVGDVGPPEQVPTEMLGQPSECAIATFRHVSCGSAGARGRERPRYVASLSIACSACGPRFLLGLHRPRHGTRGRIDTTGGSFVRGPNGPARLLHDFPKVLGKCQIGRAPRDYSGRPASRGALDAGSAQPLGGRSIPQGAESPAAFLRSRRAAVSPA
jgi:hypothetical protein